MKVSPVAFTLTDAQDPYVPPRLDAGIYTLEEAAQPGWILVSAVCTSNSGENLDQDLLASGNSFQVYSDDSLTCTFTNQQVPPPAPALGIDKSLLSYEDLDGSGGVSLDDILTYQFVATGNASAGLVALPSLLAAFAVLISTINVAGGFLVTQRMLGMFRKQD